MRLSTPEPTTQVVPSGVTRIAEEHYPAMPATLQTAPQIRPLAQQRPNLGVIRPNQIPRLALAMPIRLALELLLDFDCYKPRR
jgi:hypothetical protein